MDKSSVLSVLVVEDSQMFRSLAMQVLTGYNKQSAVTAKEGIAQYKAYRPDITFLDIDLPDGNGLDVLLTIKSIDPKAFVIMLTQSRIASDVEKAIHYGAAGYIIKPFSRTKIEQCLAIYNSYKKKIQDMPDEAFIPPLPIVPEESSNQEEQAPAWKILFVDDYYVNLVHAQKHFTQLGCEVDTAGDANQALELIKRNNYNLIFVDGCMPEKDGYMLANEIRRGISNLNHRTPIVGLAENFEETEDQRWLRAGMNSYIVKPVKFSKLKEVVQSYMENPTI